MASVFVTTKMAKSFHHGFGETMILTFELNGGPEIYSFQRAITKTKLYPQ